LPPPQTPSIPPRPPIPSSHPTPTPGRRGEAQRLAARLFHLDGFKKSQVAAFLRKNNDFSGMVAQEYLDFFQFGGQTLDQALRSFLQALVLTGETQERERILGHFSRRYHHCNPGAFPSPGSTRTPTLLPQRLGRAMTSAEFVANLSGMMDGQDFPREQLKRRRKRRWRGAAWPPPAVRRATLSWTCRGGPGLSPTAGAGWPGRCWPRLMARKVSGGGLGGGDLGCFGADLGAAGTGGGRSVVGWGQVWGFLGSGEADLGSVGTRGDRFGVFWGWGGADLGALSLSWGPGG
uniref:SEC7 domain-containing protein n=1 Tax=Accipiter nisus TaxID=211598 RepID=A0A8B9NL51_9AVES